jgi:hypothetical protein
LGQELTEHGRRRKESTVTHRHGSVDISKRAGVARQKLFTLYATHCGSNGRVGDTLGPQLALDHGFACCGEIGNGTVNGHDCYMPLIHLKFKLARATAAGAAGEAHIWTAAISANCHSSKD